MQVSRYADIQIYRHPDMQISRYVGVQICRYAQIGVAYCPVMSFVFVCIEIQNENQLGWATKIRGALPKIQILAAAVI